MQVQSMGNPATGLGFQPQTTQITVSSDAGRSLSREPALPRDLAVLGNRLDARIADSFITVKARAGQRDLDAAVEASHANAAIASGVDPNTVAIAREMGANARAHEAERDKIGFNTLLGIREATTGLATPVSIGGENWNLMS